MNYICLWIFPTCEAEFLLTLIQFHFTNHDIHFWGWPTSLLYPPILLERQLQKQAAPTQKLCPLLSESTTNGTEKTHSFSPPHLSSPKYWNQILFWKMTLHTRCQCTLRWGVGGKQCITNIESKAIAYTNSFAACYRSHLVGIGWRGRRAIKTVHNISPLENQELESIRSSNRAFPVERKRDSKK